MVFDTEHPDELRTIRNRAPASEARTVAVDARSGCWTTRSSVGYPKTSGVEGSYSCARHRLGLGRVRRVGIKSWPESSAAHRMR